MPPWSLSSPNIKCVLLLALVLLPLLAGTAHAQSVIDVAVFYTPQAKTAHGGTAQIKTKIDELVVATNMAYADSGVSQTINLVAVEEVVGYTESLSTGSAFTSIDAMYVDLDRLQSKSDGYMDEVHTIRDRMWADAVILLRSRDGGLANFMGARSTKFASLAFGVSIADAGIFAHELGHLMGLRHDRYVECRHDTDNPLCPPNYPYAYGYVNQKAFEEGAATSKRWTTIMAYKTQCSQNNPRFDCERVLYFSNPSNSYPRNNGDPMGVAGTQITNAVDGPANAALRLNETRTTVAEFRQGRAVKVSFDAGSYAVTEGGTVTVTVQLDAAPGRTLDLPIPLTATSTDGAWPGDYTLPASITFGANQTSRTFTFRANAGYAPRGPRDGDLGLWRPAARRGGGRQSGYRHGDADRQRHRPGCAERQHGGAHLEPRGGVCSGGGDCGRGGLHQAHHCDRHTPHRADDRISIISDGVSGRPKRE